MSCIIKLLISSFLSTLLSRWNVHDSIKQLLFVLAAKSPTKLLSLLDDVSVNLNSLLISKTCLMEMVENPYCEIKLCVCVHGQDQIRIVSCGLWYFWTQQIARRCKSIPARYKMRLNRTSMRGDCSLALHGAVSSEAGAYFRDIVQHHNTRSTRPNPVSLMSISLLAYSRPRLWCHIKLKIACLAVGLWPWKGIILIRHYTLSEFLVLGSLCKVSTWEHMHLVG